jgi:hypothetical protein
MGNRAVITFDKKCSPNSVGLYLHWNGGEESIKSFLAECIARGYRSPACDPSYAMARLTQVVCEFFPDGLSVGIGRLKEMDCDNGDNGLYIVGNHWEIIGRKYA